ncbi:MAG TPA: hypothetical protein VH309_01420 [Elusimicrobiota bacterium]|nr:hypothetical protein [Elusimicrobiota bacterium]
MRRNRLAGAALAAALAAGCRRAPAAPPPDPAGGVALAAPAPSSNTVTSPLAADTSDYTNEMQAQNLRDQASQLGIQQLSKPSVDTGDEDDDGPHRTITYQEGIERTREMTREVEAERRAIEGDKNKSVALPTPTPGMISAKTDGGPIESSSGTR